MILGSGILSYFAAKVSADSTCPVTFPDISLLSVIRLARKKSWLSKRPEWQARLKWYGAILTRFHLPAADIRIAAAATCRKNRKQPASEWSSGSHQRQSRGRKGAGSGIGIRESGYNYQRADRGHAVPRANGKCRTRVVWFTGLLIRLGIAGGILPSGKRSLPETWRIAIPFRRITLLCPVLRRSALL